MWTWGGCYRVSVVDLSGQRVSACVRGTPEPGPGQHCASPRRTRAGAPLPGTLSSSWSHVPVRADGRKHSAAAGPGRGPVGSAHAGWGRVGPDGAGC